MCTSQPSGLSEADLIGMLSVPGLIVPVTFLPSHVITISTSFPSALLPVHVPSHDPLSGWPSCAMAGTTVRATRNAARTSLFIDNILRPATLERLQAPLSRRIRADFGFPLCILEVAQLRSHTSINGGHLRSGLKTCEVGPIAPGERPAEPDTRLERGVVDDVDGAFVVGVALPESREVPQVAAGGE